jgi:hypothetical protein
MTARRLSSQQQQQQQLQQQKDDDDEQHQQQQQQQQYNMVFFDEDETKDGFSDEEIDKPLTWRGDPKETLSDWTVVVCYYGDGGGAAEETYHVHKSILGASQRKSNWFASLFRSQNASAQAESLSRITFDVPVIEHFAVVLDFMYFGTLDINSANSVALRFLANYLSCRSLMAAANEFIKNDLNRHTAVDYILEASKLKDIRLVSGARLACCKLFSEMEKSAFEVLPPSLLEAIICSPDLVSENPYDVSLTISNYLYAKPESLSDRFLYALTDERIMTEVDPYSARVFLNAIRRLEKDGHRSKNPSDDTNWNQTKSLSLRCARVLALEWRSMLPLDLQDEYIQLWKKESRASSLVLVSLLASAVDRAQLEVEELERGLGNGVSEREEDMIVLQKNVLEKDEIILTLRRELQEKESDLLRLSSNSQEKDMVIAEKQKAIQELKRIRISKEEELSRTKNDIREKIHEKDRLLLEAHGALEDKDGEIKRLYAMTTEKDMIIREKQKIIGELKVSIDRIKANNAATASTGMFTRRAFNFGTAGTGSEG